jgi:hypothetical protein
MNIVETHRKPAPPSNPSISRINIFAAPWQSSLAFVTSTSQFFVAAPSSINTYGLDCVLDGGVEITSA